MIHQVIFAHARPDWTEAQFQNHWLNVHAVQFASRIPQIRLYKVNLRLPMETPFPAFGPPFQGCAEIWVRDLQEQLESWRSPEYIDNARVDEPRWAAFWDTVFLATDTHVLVDAPERERCAWAAKLYVVLKRRGGMRLGGFHGYVLQVHGEKLASLPGLRRLHVCTVIDTMYSLGEPLLDAVTMLSFDDTASLAKALASPAFTETVAPDYENFAEPSYVRCMVSQEHWVIGPDPR